jgi:hypothetical protein
MEKLLQVKPDVYTLRETFLSTTLSTTHNTWTEPRSNSAFLGERPVTNHLSYTRTSKTEMRSRCSLCVKIWFLVR